MKRRGEKKRERFSAKKFAEKTGFESNMLTINSDQMYQLKEEGTKRIDVIPFVAGKGNPDADEGERALNREYFAHRQVGPNKTYVVCPAKTANKRCPICEEYLKIRAKNPNKGTPDYELMNMLKPSRRQLWNVKEDGEKDIKVFDIAAFFFGDEVQKEINREPDDDDENPIPVEDKECFADPTDGLSLRLDIVKSDFGKGFRVDRVTFKRRKKQFNEKIVKKAYCLDDLLKIKSYKELQDIFLQTPDEEEDDDNDSGTTSKKGKNMKRDSITAKKAGIKKGDKVTHDDLPGECKVVTISKDQMILTIEDEDGDKHKVAVAEVEKVTKGKKGGKKSSKKDDKKAKGKKGKGKVKDDDDDDEDDEDEEEEDDDDEDSDDDDDEDDDDESEDDDDDDSDEDDDDEDEEEDEDDEDEDDDEEEDEDDDDDEDEEEEEEKPKKKGGKAKGKKGKKK